MIVTIIAPGLISQSITVTADSTVSLLLHEAGYNVYSALLVDGHYYDLCMFKHTIGRPELVQALDLALAAVAVAIEELQPAQPLPRHLCPGCGENWCIGECRCSVADNDAAQAAAQRLAALPIAQIIEHLPQVRDAALVAIAADTKLTDAMKERWVKATHKAYGWLVEQDALDYDADTGELTMVSPDSGKEYVANGSCGCEAYNDGIAYRGIPDPCYHRSASRLIRRCLARQSFIDQAAVVADAISELDNEGGHYEGADVSERTRALNARIAAARAAVASVEGRQERSAGYKAAEASLLECWS